MGEEKDEGFECPYDGIAYNKISGYDEGYGCPVCGGIGEAHTKIYPKGPLLSSDIRRMVEHVKLLREGTFRLRVVDSDGIEFQGMEAQRLRLSEPVAIFRTKPSDLDKYPEEWLKWALAIKKVWEKNWSIPLIIIPPDSDVQVVEPVVEEGRQERGMDAAWTLLDRAQEPVEPTDEDKLLWWVLMDVAKLSLEEVQALPVETRRKLAGAVAKIAAKEMIDNR